MNIHEWVRAARRHAGLTQAQLGELIGVTKGNVSAWETGRHEPSYANLVRIAELTGFAQQLPGLPRDAGTAAMPHGTKAIPLVRGSEMGAILESPVFEPSQPVKRTVTDLPVSDRAFAVILDDDSMRAPAGRLGESFEVGDRLVVDAGAWPSPGDFVAAVSRTSGAVIRKYRLLRAATHESPEVFELVPLNPDYPTERSDEADLKVRGKVVEYRKVFA